MVHTILQYPALPSAYATVSGKRRIDMIVLHSTAGSKAGDLFTLSGRDHSHLVSIHYYITKLGEIYQLVQDKDVAWHAGVSYWQGEGDCNKYSLGIELENLNDGSDPYPETQIDSLLWLCQIKVGQYNIPQSRFVRHLDIAPGRKSDPRAFPWETFCANLYRDVPVEPPPPPVPDPSPEEKLRDALLDWSYVQVRHHYHPDWALHQYAIRERLGCPISPTFRFNVGRQVFVGELYGVDAICSPLGDWQNISRLSKMEEGDTKATFRATAYRQLGVEYHPDWAQHQYADANWIGVPLSENVHLVLPDGRAFGTQVFALDTLYSPDGMWSSVLTLTALNAATNISADDRVLRDALINQQYQRVGAKYHPDWATHQTAIKANLGAPLADQDKVTVGQQEYMAQPFARTILYSPVGDWIIVQQVDDLLSKEVSMSSLGGFL
ncbi:MAG: hypothetical protein NVSMB42_08250 [Herpetosiphon sp.]